MKQRLADRAKGRWPEILVRLGVGRQFLTGKNGPCPLCGGKDRWRFINRQGDGFWVCNHCGSGDGAGLAMRLLNLDFHQAAKRIEEIVDNVTPLPVKRQDPDRQRRLAENVWRNARPFGPSDPAGMYLARRGITEVPLSLRQAELPYDPDGPLHPVMVAKVVGPDGYGVNLHRTYLTPDGKKLDVEKPRKMMPGPIPVSSAVRLGAADETLGICEGIETGLAVQRLFSVPVWATLGDSTLERFEPPDKVKHLLIFGDNDKSYAGQCAAYSVAKRLAQRVVVRVFIPPEQGTDWNDVLMKEAAA